jgi:hypothetical protein
MHNNDISVIAGQQLAEAIENHIEASADIIEEISELEMRIHSWNMEDCRELRGWMVNMRKLLAQHFQIKVEKFTDIRKIPTQKIPEVLVPMYGIVAVDKRGICLYGKEMDKLAHVDQIKQHYRKHMQMKKREND